MVQAQSQTRLARPLRMIAIGTILGPLMLLVYATWANYKIIDKRSSERIERGLDVLQEHALKVFQTVEHAMAEANEVLRGSSDEGIRSNETFNSERFKRIHEGLPQIQSIWAFDAEGRPLVA